MHRSAVSAMLCALCIPLATLPLTAQAASSPAVPGFAEVSGHAFGERITVHSEMVAYLERLAETSDRVTLLRQGNSWEGRALLAAVVTSPGNHARLEAIRQGAADLADPRRTAPEEAEALIERQPVVIWFGGSIHGNELSGSEGLLKLLERMTTGDDREVRRALAEAVVIVDPMLNPDGRDAFARTNQRRAGGQPNPRSEDWGNDYTGWEGVGFRTGHYYFDTNRDWFAQTQTETRARAPTVLDWHPQISVDAHEMGPSTEFYFDPAAEPYGPHFPPYARRWFERFGDAYAAAFDSAGFEYKTREQYNYFYPGYTTSWSSYQGSVGMLYEQGSPRGLAGVRPDESVRTLAEALEHQYLAAWTAVRTAVDGRTEILRDYYAAGRAALEEGRAGVRQYLIPDGGDPGRVAELVDLLRRNGIEVGRLTDDLRLEDLRDREGRAAGSRRFGAGSFVVEAAQPRSRLLRVLLDPRVPLPPAFVAEARARVERDENPRFYDITSWSLPLLFDVAAFGMSGGLSPPTEPIGEGDVIRARRRTFPSPPPQYAYLIDGQYAASMAVYHHLRTEGYRAGLLTRPTQVAGTDVPGGTVVVKRSVNDATVDDAVRRLADRYAVDVHGVDTGHPEAGFPALGSGHVRTGPPARVAMLAEGPVAGYSFGWAWHTLEEAYGVPITVLRSGSLSGQDLAPFNVLVIPALASAEGLAEELGESTVGRLAAWVHEGGTLVTIGSATEFARQHLELAGLRDWYETDEGEDAYRFSVPGAILAAELDTLSWLTAGYDRPTLPVLVGSSRVYLPPQGPPDSDRRVVGRYAGSAEELVLSGHAWRESRERLPGAVFLYEERAGAGRVIAFAEDPNYRGYWRGADRLFLNAVLGGPAGS